MEPVLLQLCRPPAASVGHARPGSWTQKRPVASRSSQATQPSRS